MSVEQLPRDTFRSDRQQADRTVRIWLDHCLANVRALRSLRSGARHIQAVLDFQRLVESGESLSPAQRRYLESIYEKTFEAKGFDACRTHSDKHSWKQ